MEKGQLLVDRYLVVQQLSAGGFSQTYLVRDRYLPGNPLCILKRLQLEENKSVTPNEMRNLFSREADILHKIGQKNTSIPALFAHVDGECPYIIEEYIEGMSLEAYFEDLALSGKIIRPKELESLLYEILEILKFVHGQGIIHQDIKPSNLIRRASDKKIVLIDFGAATYAEAQSLADYILGTPGYIAPEQEAGLPVFASDLYSLGIMLICLASGICPEQLMRDESGEIDWLSHLDFTLPPSLERVLSGLVKADWRTRYQAAADAQLDLSAHSSAVKTPGRFLKLRIRLSAAGAAALVGGLITVAAGTATMEASLRPVSVDPLALFALPTSNKRRLSLVRTDVLANKSVQQMHITEDNRLVVITPEQVYLFDLRSGTLLAEIVASNRQEPVVSSGQWMSVNGILWDLSTMQQSRSMPKARNPIFGQEGDKIFAVQDGSIKAWPTRDEDDRVWSWNPRDVNRVLFAADESLIYETLDHRIILINPATSRVVRVLAGHTSSINSIQLKNNQLFSFSSDGGMIWNLQDGFLQVMPKSFREILHSCWYGELLLTVDRQGNIQLWNPQDEKIERLGKIDGVMAVGSDGYLVSYNENEIRIWQLL